MLTTTDTVNLCNQIVTFDNSYVTKSYILLNIIYVIYVKLYIFLHSAKLRMRYNPQKMVAYGCKLHVKVWSPLMSDPIFITFKDSRIYCFLNYNWDTCSLLSISNSLLRILWACENWWKSITTCSQYFEYNQIQNTNQQKKLTPRNKMNQNGYCSKLAPILGNGDSFFVNFLYSASKICLILFVAF